MNNNVFWLNEITIANEKLFGNKILSLFKIQKNSSLNDNIYIPDTFIINKNAFEYFLSYNKIQDKINSLLKSIIYQNLENIFEISKKIENIIIESSIPENIIYEIKEKYIILKKKNISFAIRSSASDEDGKEASFAGQQNSYLNIKNLSDILTKIKLVYASLYSVQSISYRKKKQYSNF